MSGECNFCDGEHTEARCPHTHEVTKWLSGCFEWDDLTEEGKFKAIGLAELGKAVTKTVQDWKDSPGSSTPDEHYAACAQFTDDVFRLVEALEEAANEA